MLKVCKGCNNEKPLDAFGILKSSSDGLNWNCIPCAEGIRQRYRDKHPDRVKASRKKYNKNHPDKYRDSLRRYRARNVERLKQWRVEYKKRKPEIIQNRQKRYANSQNGKDVMRIAYQRRRAKAKELPSDFTREQWEACKLYFDNKCAYCGKERKICQDHFVPVASGGEYTINNIIPACNKCNGNKQAYNFFEWYPSWKYYSRARERKILRYLKYADDKIQQLTLTV